MDRLITDEEIKVGMSDIKNQWLHSKGVKRSFEQDCLDAIVNLNRFAQDIKTRQATLKEVGTCLQGYIGLTSNKLCIKHYILHIPTFDFEALLRGEMPESIHSTGA